MATPLFALYADKSELDQICADLETAKEERADLRAMGCEVMTLEISSDFAGRAEEVAYEIDNHLREKGNFGRKALRKFEAERDCKIRMI